VYAFFLASLSQIAAAKKEAEAAKKALKAKQTALQVRLGWACRPSLQLH